MSKLISDWFCVATSGPTVDGREIKHSWLKDMAETYGVSVYAAMLWYEHYRWGGNFGTVEAVKVEKNDQGGYCLFNRLSPSPQMLELNRAGQKLHTSIEVLTEFRGKKKAYQYGLGITDSPASVGTDRLAFSAGGAAPDDETMTMMNGVCTAFNAGKIDQYKERVTGVNKDHLEIFVSQPLPDLEFSKERSFFNFGNLFGGTDNNDKTEGNDMNQQETDARIDAKLEAFGTELLGKVTELFKQSGATPPPATPPATGAENNNSATPPPATPPATGAENNNSATPPPATPPAATENNSAGADDSVLVKLNATIEKLGTDFKTLSDKIENIPAAGSFRDEATGGDADADQFDA